LRGFIDRELIETIRLQTDIVEVVEEYFPLTKKGRVYLALCPFHREKTPSFTVSREKQIFHCFGCGAGGNAYQFLMSMENLTFPEAVKRLAARKGMVVPEVWSREEQKKSKNEERLWEINALARDFYKKYLHERQEGAPARKYLSERGLKKETLLLFNLGYAPDHWGVLIDFLRKHNYSLEEITAAGLTTTSESGKTFDRFRRRIMFPISNPQGKVIGFGGRSLGEEHPKYLNSPETTLFNKRYVFYALDLARQAIKETDAAIIMEGYMDVISAHQAGVNNAVASLGTSLTKEQGILLKRYTSDVVIAYDTDGAGIAAALRASDILQEQGFRIHVVSFPQEKDPDEFFRRHDRKTWDELVKTAPKMLEYKIDQVSKNTRDKKKILQELIPSIAKITSPTEQEESIKLITRQLNLSWDVIKSELQGFRADRRKKWPISDKIVKKSHNIITDAKKTAEQEIVRLVLQKPDYLPVVRKEFGTESIDDPCLRNIFTLISMDNLKSGPAGWMDQLEEREQKLLCRLLIEKPLLGDSDEVLKDLLKTCRTNEYMLKRESLLKEIAQAEKSNQQEKVKLLLRELEELLGLPKRESGPLKRGNGLL